MSCCGEPNNAPVPENRAVNTYNNQTVNQQPTPHPGFQGQPISFQQPNISSPPNAYSQNSFGPNGVGQSGFQQPNGFQQPQQNGWSHSPSPPPMNQFGQPNQPNLHAPTPSTYNASTNSYGTMAPLLQPSPVHTPSQGFRSSTASPPGQMVSPAVPPPQQAFKPPSDEGKMSVSIDFGPSAFLTSGKMSSDFHFILQVPHSQVL